MLKKLCIKQIQQSKAKFELIKLRTNWEVNKVIDHSIYTKNKLKRREHNKFTMQTREEKKERSLIRSFENKKRKKKENEIDLFHSSVEGHCF